ncbi:MAG: RtcB family protein [Candidatus Thorarchaeota archaeon]|jgi:tRNA-splicing ligase RtcB
MVEMKLELREKRAYVWEMPRHGEMRVVGKVYGDKTTVEHLHADVKAGKQWNALRQVYNVACLPGLQKASLAMPDVHPGYGYPIGGVGAFDLKEGVISVGGVGFDAGCNVANIRVPLKRKDIEDKKKMLAEALYRDIPAGLGIRGKISISWDQLDEILEKGARFTIDMGYGYRDDARFMEMNGSIKGADPYLVSDTAKKRESKQLGTLGSGNHYLEVQYVDEVFDREAAVAFGLVEDGIIVSIHCGSRALGHQVGTDYLKVLDAASKKYRIPIRERELVCAPIESDEGRRYFSAIKAAMNYGYANKEVLVHLSRSIIARIFGLDETGMPLLYVISHNSVMQEEHKADGKVENLLVHRKGATRAFGPGNKELPMEYIKVGQPVLVGGTMGTCSYILKGTEIAMKETFGSACHGAGRRMSRRQALRTWRGEHIINDLAKKGIVAKGHGWKGIAEESPGAYKDVNQVVNVIHGSGIATKVAKVRPLICIKG